MGPKFTKQPGTSEFLQNFQEQRILLYSQLTLLRISTSQFSYSLKLILFISNHNNNNTSPPSSYMLFAPLFELFMLIFWRILSASWVLSFSDCLALKWISMSLSIMAWSRLNWFSIIVALKRSAKSQCTCRVVRNDAGSDPWLFFFLFLFWIRENFIKIKHMTRVSPKHIMEETKNQQSY